MVGEAGRRRLKCQKESPREVQQVRDMSYNRRSEEIDKVAPRIKRADRLGRFASKAGVGLSREQPDVIRRAKTWRSPASGSLTGKVISRASGSI